MTELLKVGVPPIIPLYWQDGEIRKSIWAKRRSGLNTMEPPSEPWQTLGWPSRLATASSLHAF